MLLVTLGVNKAWAGGILIIEAQNLRFLVPLPYLKGMLLLVGVAVFPISREQSNIWDNFPFLKGTAVLVPRIDDREGGEVVPAPH